jgi:hypothetical protein
VTVPIRRLLETALYCDDVPRTAAFYAQPLPTAGGLVPGHDGGGPVHIAFAIDLSDLAPWESRIGSLGIAIESRVTWDSGGISIYFRDPDGRSVELATPGLWPTY